MKRMMAIVTMCAMAALTVGCAGSFEPTSQTHSSNPDEQSGDETEGRTVSGKADIYGEDGRQEYYQTESPTLRRVADATAMLVDEGDVDVYDDGTAQLETESLRSSKNVCESEPYAEQPVPGFCSGFLVAPDTLVTAGHCVDTQTECRETSVVFGVRYDDPESDPATRPKSDVYHCDEIIERSYVSGGVDFGVLRLDRAVPDRQPLDYRKFDRIDEGASVAMVGHPVGLPVKIDVGGRVHNSSDDTFIEYNLDTYGGNSGSPIVDPATGIVEAVHVRGTTDFTRPDGRSCRVSRVCEEVDPDDSSCGGNDGTRSTEFAPFVVPPEPANGWYRFDKASQEAAPNVGPTSAPVYVPRIGSIREMRVSVQLQVDTPGLMRVRLERKDADAGGESILLEEGTPVGGDWEAEWSVDGIEGRTAEGLWNVYVELGPEADISIASASVFVRPDSDS